VNTNYSGASPLVAALNDAARTRIGNPWRGTYQISIATDDVHETTAIAERLDGLDITYQANYRRDRKGRPKQAFLAIYDLASQQRLLEACGKELQEARRTALDTLVRARGPIPDELMQKIRASSEFGRSEAYIAERMNQLQIVDGMGGKGWTVKKVQAALSKDDPRASQRREAA
jgi:hypothetical protein